MSWLAEAGVRYWQVLPLGPTGYGDSPYQSFSAFAGNPYLVSPELLVADGLLDAVDPPDFPEDRVDFGAIIPWKLDLLDRAYARLPGSGLGDEFAAFRHAEAGWLEDYARFMALKEGHGGGPWPDWPPDATAEGDAIERHAFRQFLFFRQWRSLRAHAAGRGVHIIGDAPIFVAHDSADMWAHPDLFLPDVVAGVPPDYFSRTGQLWGNPLYDWAAHAATGYEWWIDRLRAVFAQVDVVRIDHFRAFADYWEIPADAPTAETGRWVDGPGTDFFAAAEAALGKLPIIAEDLGAISPAVPALRDDLGLPGMKILQFAFGGDPDDEFLPHTYPERCVAYTGTHDNDTTLGWYRSASRRMQRWARRYLRCTGRTITHAMIDAVWGSPAMLAEATLQDFLNLGTEARMNLPGRPWGNWQWRVTEDALGGELAARVRELNEQSGRAP